MDGREGDAISFMCLRFTPPFLFLKVKKIPDLLSFYFMQKSINSPLFCTCELETVLNVEHLLSSPVFYINYTEF